MVPPNKVGSRITQKRATLGVIGEDEGIEIAEEDLTVEKIDDERVAKIARHAHKQLFSTLMMRCHFLWTCSRISKLA